MESDKSDMQNLIAPIDHLKFTIFKNEEVEKYSVVEINQPNLGGPNSVYSPEMGVLEAKKECITCGQDFWECPGHFGHISLNAPIPHPFYKVRISKFANIFCKNKYCNRLLIKKDHAIIMDLRKKKPDARLQEIYELCSKLDECPHCEEANGQVKFCPKENKFFITYGNKETKYPMKYTDLDTLFDNIREKDLAFLGYKHPDQHPRHMIIHKFPVCPPCIRPYVSFDGNMAHDDLTYKYIEIIKTNNKLKDIKNEKKEMDLIDTLDMHLTTIMDNTKRKVRDNNKRILKCVNSRINGKQGRIRKYICGKRTDFSARTVIGPEVNFKVDELVIPIEVAEKLTYPVTVNASNMKYCNELIEAGKVNFVRQKRIVNGVEKTINFNMAYAAFEVKGTELYDYDKIVRNENGKIVVLDYTDCKTAKGKFELKAGDKIMRHRQRKLIDVVLPKKRKIVLKEGDVVERQLKNGDWVLLNRQPSLRADSMRAKKIRILPGKTFRFNLASTEGYNADQNSTIYRRSATGELKRL